MPNKILFVDDQFATDPEVLIDIFDDILNSSEKKRLKDLENNPMGIGIRDIKKILEDNPCLTVFDSLDDVVDLISRTNDILSEYELFIFDRNLLSSAGGTGQKKNYDRSKLEAKTHIRFDENYEEQEGDFLADYLLSRTKPEDITKLFARLYFYSAYNAVQRKQTNTQFAARVENGNFSKDHFIDKTAQGKEKLKEVIAKRKLIIACEKYRDHIKFLDPILEILNKKDQVPSNQSLKDKLLLFLSIDEDAAQTVGEIGFLRNILQELILYVYDRDKNYFKNPSFVHKTNGIPKTIITSDLMADARINSKDIPPFVSGMIQGKPRKGVFPYFIGGLFMNINNGLSTVGHTSANLPKWNIMVIKYSLLSIISWLDKEFNNKIY